MNVDVLDMVKTWLEEGSVEAESVEDLPWEVEVFEEGEVRKLVAISVVFPKPLLVFYSEEEGVLRMVIETGIKTRDLDRGEKLYFYRFLLWLNQTPLVKAYLFGGDDEVAIVGDLSAKSLGREEFNDMLALMMLTTLRLYDQFGMPKQVEEESLQVLMAAIAKWVEEGRPRDKLVKLLAKRGMSREEAEQLIDEVLEYLRGRGERGGDSLTVI